MLTEETGSVLEIVIDGLNETAIGEAMRAGIEAVCQNGPDKGIYRISAGNYGGKLGPYHFHPQGNTEMRPYRTEMQSPSTLTIC